MALGGRFGSVKIFVATNNKGKLAEIRRILDIPDVELVSPEDLPVDYAAIEETGETFEENARIKALAAARATDIVALADDSGLEVDALGGAPGVFSARYAGEGASDSENNEKLVSALRSVTSPRRARYVAVMVLASPEGEILAESRGACEGEIGFTPAGTGGFGYDPLFIPAGHERTMAELSPDEKNAISHRGAALRALRPQIESLLKR